VSGVRPICLALAALIAAAPAQAQRDSSRDIARRFQQRQTEWLNVFGLVPAETPLAAASRPIATPGRLDERGC
jgi:type II secretory pathway component PulK